MGRAALPDSYALIIFPESSIHTFFMRVPIDVLFVDRSDKVYPKPHWDGSFVILVDDGDVLNPPDREGRVPAG